MELKVGEILEGKVKSITNFGAFVLLPGNRTGLVHISEVSDTYVKEIREHLTEGQTVRVKVLSVDDAGKIALSIRRALAPKAPAKAAPASAKSAAPSSFEEKLKRFMQESDSRLADSRRAEYKPRPRRK